MDEQSLESARGDRDVCYQMLVDSLYDLIKSYRALLTLVRKEREILISADIEQLNDSNREKESILLRIRNQEKSRQKHARDFAQWLGADMENPQLLDFVSRLSESDPVKSDKLRSLYSVVTLLLKRLAENNQQNEALVRAALDNITGAMNAIKDAFTESPTYEAKGAARRSSSGHLVRREV